MSRRRITDRGRPLGIFSRCMNHTMRSDRMRPGVAGVRPRDVGAQRGRRLEMPLGIRARGEAEDRRRV